MNVFDDRIREMDRQVIVAEIPEPLDAELGQTGRHLMGGFSWDTQHRYRRMIAAAKLLQAPAVLHRDSLDDLADEVGILIENADQVEPAGFKRHVVGDGAP